jgi:hypothetical protein
MSADNKAMQGQRQAEKAAMAAQFAGKKGPTGPPAAGGGHNKSSGGAGGSAGSGSKGVSISGSKQEWVNLINILKAGGREDAGGLHAVDFGIGYSNRILSKAAREQKKVSNGEHFNWLTLTVVMYGDQADMVPYEKLPAQLRAQMTKKEYENSAGAFRSNEDELESDALQPHQIDYGLLPAVIFCFSKKKCEEIADNLKGQDLLTSREKGSVRYMFAQMLKRLNPLDAALPQLHRMEEMLVRGIAVHHGGLLPILKECVELLFSQSVVKVLIATETFAMGSCWFWQFSFTAGYDSCGYVFQVLTCPPRA